MADAITFVLGDGLTWTDHVGSRHTMTDLDDWVGKRGTSGRMAPRGFPRDNRFVPIDG